MTDEEALDFFAALSGKLNIELTEAPKPIAPSLLNLHASPTARIANVSLHLEVWRPETEDFRELTDDEWNLVCLREPRIKMRGESETVVSHEAPNGEYFTLRDLADAVVATERKGRDASDWYGGVDVHHVYFEGIELEEDGVWCISWGS